MGKQERDNWNLNEWLEGELDSDEALQEGASDEEGGDWNNPSPDEQAALMDVFREMARRLRPDLTVPVSRYEANRNDPCPCGSGKKFKRCHGEKAG